VLIEDWFVQPKGQQGMGVDTSVERLLNRPCRPEACVVVVVVVYQLKPNNIELNDLE